MPGIAANSGKMRAIVPKIGVIAGKIGAISGKIGALTAGFTPIVPVIGAFSPALSRRDRPRVSESGLGQELDRT